MFTFVGMVMTVIDCVEMVTIQHLGSSNSKFILYFCTMVSWRLHVIACSKSRSQSL